MQIMNYDIVFFLIYLTDFEIFRLSFEMFTSLCIIVYIVIEIQHFSYLKYWYLKYSISQCLEWNVSISNPLDAVINND